jgi:branched-chain amino acid transport system ATP-binding protein
MSDVLLDVRHSAAGYGALRIVQDVSLAASPGAVTALLGANGAGKTTLMRTLCGLLPLAAGSIYFNGEDIGRWPSDRRVAAGLVLVPEGRMVFANLSVEDNLRLGAITPRARLRWRARRDEMYDLFSRLKERRAQAAGTLSGGEQQMLAIARGLMSHPKLLLLDEPTLGLAPIMCTQVFALLRQLNDDGLSMLLAEQDVHTTLAFAATAYVMENGRISASGPAAQLREDVHIKQAYMGL